DLRRPGRMEINQADAVQCFVISNAEHAAAGPVGIDRFAVGFSNAYKVAGGFEDGGEPASLALGALGLEAKLPLLDRGPHSGAQPAHPVLEQIVRRTTLDTFDRLLFTDCSRDHDEWHIEPALSQQLERPKRVEPG